MQLIMALIADEMHLKTVRNYNSLMKIVVATTTDSFWLPQVAAIAEAMRQQGCPAVVVTPQSLTSAAGVSCDVLFCLGTDESLRPILSAIPARRKILYLMESVPTL